MKLIAAGAFAIALLFSGALPAQEPATAKPETQAQTAAESWLALIDDGKYDDSWAAAAPALQKLVPKERWNKALSAARAPMGKLVSRKLESAQYTHTLPGAPDGEYVVLKFNTELTNKKTAVETVTPLKDTDGAWKVSGYYIK